MQVLTLVADGLTNREIGQRLDLSPLTIKSHMARCAHKLQAGDRAELVAAVQTAIVALPLTQRQVITLRDVEGLSAEEVCEVLMLSDGNQRVLLHRARLRVRAALGTVVSR